MVCFIPLKIEVNPPWTHEPRIFERSKPHEIKLDQVSQIIPIKLKLHQITSITHFEVVEFPLLFMAAWSEVRTSGHYLPGLLGSVVGI